MNISNLLFFDRNGEPLNLEYKQVTTSPDTGYWYGEMYVEPLSIALFDNLNFFVLEKIGSSYYFPQANVGDTFKIEWTSGDVPEFFIYNVQIDPEQNLPFINKIASQTVEYISAFNMFRYPLEFNVAFNPSDEAAYERTLTIYYIAASSPQTKIKIAEISFYSEGVGEDERFAVWLSNFGLKFNKNDALMLKDYDIKEALPDWNIINTKRKELLVNKEEIFPYVGTYRGLINIIDILGFKDILLVKEYWTNIDSNSAYFNKMLLVDISSVIDRGTVDSLELVEFNRNVKFDNAFKKTGFLALSYEFTRENGSYDADGLPEIEVTTEFTPNEIFFKLTKLRTMLQREFLPTNVIIKDIIGEYVYYFQYIFKTWHDDVDVTDIDVNEELSINIYPVNDLRIRDIRTLYRYKYPTGGPWPATSFNNGTIDPYERSQMVAAGDIDLYCQAITDFYNAYKPDTNTDIVKPVTFDSCDDHETAGGCPVILSVDMPKLKIAELDGLAWNDFRVADVSPHDFSYFTWENLKFKNLYEIEWIITHKEGQAYSFKIRGPLNKYYRLPHVFPYKGTYGIKIKAYDFFGGASIVYENELVVIDDTTPQMIGLAKLEDKFSYQISNLQNIIWQDFGDSKWYDLNVNVLYTSDPDLQVRLSQLDWFFFKNFMYDVKIYNPDYYGAYSSGGTPIATPITSPSGGSGTPVIARGRWEDYSTSEHLQKEQWGIDPEFKYKLEHFREARLSDLYYWKVKNMVFNGDFLAGFYFQNPDEYDIIRISGFDDFVCPPGNIGSPGSYIEGLVRLLNASTQSGIELYNYEIINGRVHAQSKDITKTAYHILQFIDAVVVPGFEFSGDKYTFYEPINAYSESTIQRLESEYPNMDRQMLFTCAPFFDIINGNTNNIDYWINNGYIKFENNIQSGFIPSVLDENYLSLTKIKIYKNTFYLPKFGLVFFVINNLTGINDYVWTLYDESAGVEIIRVKDVPFFVWKFNTASNYSLKAEVFDVKQNKYVCDMKRFISVKSKLDYINFVERNLTERAQKL